VLSDYHCSLTVTKFHGFLWASAVDGKLEPRNIWSRDRLGGLVPKNHAGGIRLRRQEMTEQQYQEDGGVYAFQVPGFMETKSRTYGSIFPVVVPSWRRFEIDNEEDWQICEMLHTWSRK
jgi:CMP-N-acetylneuraminic acid synthetase